MSRIVGIANADGLPADPRLLQRMAELTALGLPDACTITMYGKAGFGHAMLRASRDAERAGQPCTVDGKVWITADTRIDAREELINKLAVRCRADLLRATDAELILYAYHVWGESCVEHLIGDFAFAIWDGRIGALLCARDPMGTKPFFYSRGGGCLAFANTLNCLRLLPFVSDKLNESAVADFLLFEGNRDQTTTTFADIQRLPAAHTMHWSSDGLRIRQFWKLPEPREIRYRRSREYVEHFRAVLKPAVTDRLRVTRAAIYMSGGMDSTAIAALAQDHAAQNGRSLDLQAYTVVYDDLIPDEERHYSTMVANHLGIPIHHLPADRHEPYAPARRPSASPPEPLHAPLWALTLDSLELISSQAQVVLTGDGADPLYLSSPGYLQSMIRSRRFGTLAHDLILDAIIHRRMPRLGVRQAIRKRLGCRGISDDEMRFPTWLNPEFERRCDLKGRWAEYFTSGEASGVHRREARAAVVDPIWTHLFEASDPGATARNVEFRYPFFDVRVVSFLIALPAAPWCRGKWLARAAMKGILPEEVRSRPKAPLAGDPVTAALRRSGGWRHRLPPHPALYQYVSRQAVDTGGVSSDWQDEESTLRFWSLNQWLHDQETGMLLPRGEVNETRTGCEKEEVRIPAVA